MNVLSRSTTKTTRAGMLLQGARILLVSFLGWAAGAVVIWRFGSGSLQNDVGLLVLGAVLWAAIPLTTLRLLRRRSGTLRMERPRTWGIWFVIASLTGSAVIVIVRPMTEDWTSLQIWSAIFLLTPIGIALDTVPRLIRPAGWTSIGASTRKPIPLVLLAGSLVTFAVAVALMVGGEVAVVAVVLSLVVLGAYANSRGFRS